MYMDMEYVCTQKLNHPEPAAYNVMHKVKVNLTAKDNLHKLS